MSDAIAAIAVALLAAFSLALLRVSYWRRLTRIYASEVGFWRDTTAGRREERDEARDDADRLREENEGLRAENARLAKVLVERDLLLDERNRLRSLVAEVWSEVTGPWPCALPAEAGAPLTLVGSIRGLREERGRLAAENARLTTAANGHRADASGLAALLASAWKEIGEAGPLPSAGLKTLAECVRGLREARDRLAVANESLKATLALAREALSGG